MVSFHAGEAITVRDGLIWRIHEYATLVREAQPGEGESAARPAISRPGPCRPASSGQLAEDLQGTSAPAAIPRPGPGPATGGRGRSYSRNQISTCSTRCWGRNFYRYVNQARLQHLLDGLQATSDAGRIDELAFAAGFNRCRHSTSASANAWA